MRSISASAPALRGGRGTPRTAAGACDVASRAHSPLATSLAAGWQQVRGWQRMEYQSALSRFGTVTELTVTWQMAASDAEAAVSQAIRKGSHSIPERGIRLIVIGDHHLLIERA
jgi:hypothetical protein